jgi:hypothetical protein
MDGSVIPHLLQRRAGGGKKLTAGAGGKKPPNGEQDTGRPAHHGRRSPTISPCAGEHSMSKALAVLEFRVHHLRTTDSASDGNSELELPVGFATQSLTDAERTFQGGRGLEPVDM